MGIIVTIAQFLGLLAYFFHYRGLLIGAEREASVNLVLFQNRLAVPFLAVMGLWNIVWYGLQHLELFWGQAAIISGIVMLLAGLDLTGHRVVLARALVAIALLLCFSLYAISLIRLNLGLAIIT